MEHPTTRSLAAPSLHHHQRIEIGGQRTFQQATVEPLGEDWQDEVRGLQRARAAADTAVRTAQSNADAGTAQLRSDLAFVQRTHASLLDGPERQQLQQAAADARRVAEGVAEAAQLPLTAVRAGKVERARRQRDLRAEGDRKAKKLLPRSSGRKATLRQQRHKAAAAGVSDELPKLAKKGKAVTRVRACGDRVSRRVRCGL